MASGFAYFKVKEKTERSDGPTTLLLDPVGHATNQLWTDPMNPEGHIEVVTDLAAAQNIISIGEILKVTIETLP